jgi:hypothetical protein
MGQTTTGVSFNDSRLKIKRANQHIRELNDVLNTYMRSDFYSLAVELDAETGEEFLCFRTIKQMPESVPLIIGDAVHNLRTALDYLPCQIVRQAGGRTGYVKFPFRDTREELVAAVNGGEIKRAGTSVIATIIDEIKPYRQGGNGALCALHDLDITDKHFLLVPTMGIAALNYVDLEFGSVRMPFTIMMVEEGLKIRWAQIPGYPIKVNYKGEPSFKINFREGQPFQFEPVIPTLHQLSQLVSGCVDAIAEAYASLAGPQH